MFGIHDDDVYLTFKRFTVDETGDSHCQCGNPTLGQEVICDWFANQLGLDQSSFVE